jgi:hypothetical protein
VFVDGVEVVRCLDEVSAATSVFAVYWIFNIQYYSKQRKTLELLDKAVFKTTRAALSQPVLKVYNSLF